MKILITGSGITGPALVYWLTRSPARSSFSITILAHSPSRA
jgi:2-polyprenyl-6-methoxyphenol hydroxylase-like FAD-dependent oxidoreductase